MHDLTSIAKFTVSDMSTKNDRKISTATSQLETDMRTTVIDEVIKGQTGGVGIAGLATKQEVEDAQAAVDGKLSEQYITEEEIEQTYVTKTALAEKKYATEGYAASKAMTTAMDFCDATWAGLADKFWSTTSQSAGVGYFTTKNINNGSFAQLINNGAEGVTATYYDSISGDTSKIVINADGARYVKNLVNDTSREIAVKSDIQALRDEILSLKARLAEVESKVGITPEEETTES